MSRTRLITLLLTLALALATAPAVLSQDESPAPEADAMSEDLGPFEDLDQLDEETRQLVEALGSPTGIQEITTEPVITAVEGDAFVGRTTNGLGQAVYSAATSIDVPSGIAYQRFLSHPPDLEAARRVLARSLTNPPPDKSAQVPVREHHSDPSKPCPWQR